MKTLKHFCFMFLYGFTFLLILQCYSLLEHRLNEFSMNILFFFCVIASLQALMMVYHILKFIDSFDIAKELPYADKTD